MKKHKKKKKRVVIITLAVIGIIAAVILTGSMIFISSFQNYGKNETKPGESRIAELSPYKADQSGLMVTVKKGWNLKNISDELYRVGAITSPNMFSIIAKYYKYDTQFKAGTYFIKWNMSYTEMMKTLTGLPPVTTVYIPEHYNFYQTVDKLTEAGVIQKKDAFIRYAQKAGLGYDFEKGIPDKRKPRYEGYCFPATYSFSYLNTNEEILRMMLDAFDKKFTPDMKEKANAIGMTEDEVIILASVVQREGMKISEFPRIAGVFMNRIKSNMKLQSCATVQYIMATDDDPDTVVKTVLSNADIAIDSPYNTYKYPGLPAGPICSPGMDAIKSVLNYEHNDYYYFVAKGDGTNVFSKNYDEHLAAVNKYLP